MHWLLEWQWDPDLSMTLVAGFIIYVLCWRRVRRRGDHHIAPVGRLIFWTSGLLVVAIALLTAIDDLSDKYFSMHMIQHMLLIDLAPPLILLGRPVSVIHAAFAKQPLVTAGAGIARPNALLRSFRFILKPQTAWTVSTIALLAWHVPAAYDYALSHIYVHEFGEHLSLFIVFLIWWHPLIGTMPQLPYLSTPKGRFFYLLAGMIPGMLLGIIILFWPHVLYSFYLETPRTGGISLMLDQQLGAAVMWFSAMVVFFWMALPLQYHDDFPLKWP